VSARLRIYLVLVGLGAVALLALHLPPGLDRHWGDYVAWTCIAALSELMVVATLSGAGTVSQSSTAGLAATMLWGLGPGMWIAALSTLSAELLLLRRPWVRASFNASQIGITMWVSGRVWGWLGGPLGGVQSVEAGVLAGPGVLRLALAAFGLAVTYLIVNRALVAVAVAWSSERPYLRVLREDWFYGEKLLEDAAAFFLAPIMVISFRAVGYPGAVLFYSPLYMLHESTRRYIELRNAQNQIVHRERMAAKGEMAAEIGHELRNQLVAISGRAQLLLRDGERQAFENVNRHAQIILEQSRRMEALSKGLMDFSSAEIKVERVDVNALVQRSVEFVRTQNRFDTVEWDLEFAPQLPELRVDPGQIQQVLLNLFMNAADAMQEKGVSTRRIRMVTAYDERARTVRMTVTDSGTGIAPQNLARIFEPHFTTKATGHGFGLSTSYRIITNHGGRVTAESAPGQGATFTITLPVDGPGGGFH
jgi:signal transduction histidine kinase